jgi:hypothetical protein
MVQMTLLLLLSSTTSALASFGLDMRIDHQNQSRYSCCWCAIAVGPGAPGNQPLYVAFEGDTLYGRDDIWFQKSLDGGRTWLAEDLLIKRGDRYAMNPDITTDSDGNVYIAFVDEQIDTAGARDYHISCVRSTDGGTTWTAPARVNDSAGAIGWARIAADSAGNLICVWNDWRTGSGHIWSSVSTDRGATWRQNVQVDDDTTDYDCAHADVFVQPGTNHYLVAAQAPRWVGSHIKMCTYLYRSTDRGLTFALGIQVDTFSWFTGFPHVVADRDHIVCDYSGNGRNVRDTILTEARTFFTQADTWGTPSPVTNLDSFHELYYSGALALSDDGRVHTALTICGTSTIDSRYDVFYASSSDHGVSWSDIELVNDDTTCNGWYPDIGTDVAGHAYVVWTDGGAIWFATNAPAAVAEQPTRQPISMQPSATVVRNVLFLPKMGTVPSGAVPTFCPSLLDIGGREVMDLKPGANDVRALSPGVYFVRGSETEDGRPGAAVRKIVIAR